MKIRILILLLAAAAAVAAAQKKPVDQSVYDGWKSVKSTRISDNGEWVIYVTDPQKGDGSLGVYNTKTRRTEEFIYGSRPQFLDECRHVVFWQKAPADSVRKAKLEKRKADRLPKDTLILLSLQKMDTVHVDGVKSFQASREGSIFAYLKNLETEPEKEGKEPEDSIQMAAPTDTVEIEIPAKPKAKKSKYDQLIVRDLARGTIETIDSVQSYYVARTGSMIVYTKTIDSLTSVHVFYPQRKDDRFWQALTPRKAQISRSVPISDDGTQFALFMTEDTVKHTPYDLLWFNAQTREGRKVARESDRQMPEGYAADHTGGVSFSRTGNRMMFKVAPKREEEKKDSLPADEKFSLDIWSWHDDLLPTQQQKMDRNKIDNEVFRAAYYPAADDWTLLSDSSIENIIFAENDDAPFALGTSRLPYRRSSTWDADAGVDAYLIDIRSGERTKLLTAAYNKIQISPAGDYVVYYSPQDDNWYSIDTHTSIHRCMTEGIGVSLYNEDHDMPSIAPPYGTDGWTADGRLIVRDRYDLWTVDPAGISAPVNITRNGRTTKTTYRLVNPSFIPGADTRTKTNITDLTKPVMLSAFNEETKDDAFCTLRVGGDPKQLIGGAYRYEIAAWAENADRLVFSRESFTEFGDLWVSSKRFAKPARITDANPQQADYKWGNVSITTWTDLNGQPAKGLLYLPEDYDPSKAYPTIIYFYETHTDNLNKYIAPAPSRSIVNPTYCVSNGYVLFVPDIRYTTGYPGRSCYDIVVSGAQALIDRGIADPERIGLQGQSWGGYQVAYLVTQTDMFRCCSPGAPVSNMTSAYGGIRWGSGMARSFQYEHTQSRIGATPWEARELYIENSPLFFADKVNTPMLIRHDDADEAVPWSQGIEYYIALRRLGKEVWMLNYNNEPHNLNSRAARMDWDKRMYQFFDYYLKDTAAPRWMVEGISIKEKGRDQKYDLME